jgi:hypothetical protein
VLSVVGLFAQSLFLFLFFRRWQSFVSRPVYLAVVWPARLMIFRCIFVVVAFVIGFGTSFLSFTLFAEPLFPFADHAGKHISTSRVVVLRNMTGIAREGISFNLAATVADELSLFVRPLQEDKDSFLFLLDEEYGCVLVDQGRKLKIVW